MVRPLGLTSVYLSLEEVSVRAIQKVLMIIDDIILPIVGDPYRILDEQLRPHPIHLLNVIIILIILHERSERSERSEVKRYQKQA